MMTSEFDPGRSSEPGGRPLEKADGWSIWPVVDGIHLATRDKPLTDREVRALTPTRTLYASNRRRCWSGSPSRTNWSPTWRRRLAVASQLEPTEQYCGLVNRIEKNSFPESAAELGMQVSLYKSLISFGNKPA